MPCSDSTLRKQIRNEIGCLLLMKGHLIRSHQDIVMEAEVSKGCQFGGLWKSGCYLVYV